MQADESKVKISFKTKLNAHHQKHNKPKPIYSTVLIGGSTTNTPIYKSTLSYLEDTYESETKSLKKEAEENAAYQACSKLGILKDEESLLKDNEVQQKEYTSFIELAKDLEKEQRGNKEPIKLVLFDIDNCANEYQKVYGEFKQSHIIIILRSLSSSKNFIKSDFPDHYIYLSKSQGKVASQAAIALIIGATHNISREYVIVSKGNYSGVIKEIVGENESINIRSYFDSQGYIFI